MEDLQRNRLPQHYATILLPLLRSRIWGERVWIQRCYGFDANSDKSDGTGNWNYRHQLDLPGDAYEVHQDWDQVYKLEAFAFHCDSSRE